MKKEFRILIIILIIAIFTTSGVYVYKSSIKPYYNCYFAAQSNYTKPDQGTNITISIEPFNGASFETSVYSNPWLQLYYIGNQSTVFNNINCYDNNVFTKAINCTSNYRQTNGATALYTTIPVKTIKANKETFISVNWNGTIIQYQGNQTTKPIFEPAIPGNYAIVPYLGLRGINNTELSAKSVEMNNYIIHVEGLDLVNKSRHGNVSEKAFCIGDSKHSIAHVIISTSYYNMSDKKVSRISYENFTIQCNQTVIINTLNSKDLDELNNYLIFTQIKMTWDNFTFIWSNESFAIK